MKNRFELLGFLCENECHLNLEKNKLQFNVFIPFHAINDFLGIIGSHWIEELGIECYLKNGYIVLHISEIILENGFYINQFRSVIESSEIKEYESEIKEFNSLGNF